jgi:Cell wall-active antibiotics response LiaF, C-terminal/N-terminal domain of toast_rack, DUF2154
MQMPRLSSTLPFIALVGALTAQHVAAQDWREITTMRRFAGEDLLQVNLEYGAGRLVVGPGADNSLYRAKLRYDANVYRPLNSYDDGLLRIGITGGKISGRNMKAGRLDLALGTRVPIELMLQFGAAEAELELGGLRLQKATIQTGASDTNVRVSRPNPLSCSTARFEVGAAKFAAEGLGNLNCEDLSFSGGVGDVTLDFTGSWRADGNVDIDMGLGSLTLRLPRGLGVSVHKSSVLASFDSQGLIKRGQVYYSEGFEKSDRKLNITIDAALGSIKVLWVDGSRN